MTGGGALDVAFPSERSTSTFVFDASPVDGVAERCEELDDGREDDTTCTSRSPATISALGLSAMTSGESLVPPVEGEGAVFGTCEAFGSMFSRDVGVSLGATQPESAAELSVTTTGASR